MTAAFTAGALIGVAVDWIEGGCSRTPAEMAEVTWPLLNAQYRINETGDSSAPRPHGRGGGR